jgi:O-Antigen ligase
VISRWFRLEKFLNYLLIFLLPTQLAIHFWPPTSFVFGVRVDYLSPSIYLTDLVFLMVFILWIWKSYKQALIFVDKNKRYILLFIALATVNIIFSTSIFPSIYKWLKLIELMAFCYYVWARDDIFKSKAVLLTLFYSLISFSVIGMCQFILGKTLGGPLYLLGERTFNISTPGIALVEILGRNFMRAYSTFSHPNSLAGYLGVGLLLLIFTYSKKVLSRKILGIVIICLAFLLTFSLSAVLGVTVCSVMFILERKKIINIKNIVIIPAAFLIISLIIPFFSKIVIQNKFEFPQNINQRLELSVGAGRLISQNFFLGEGLNTFVISESRMGNLGFYLWTLQPVHNIFLLIFSETGIFGLLLIYLLLVKSTQESILLNNKAYYLALVFILTTGLFDHYWFTLQQNMFLFALVLGNSFREKR